MSVWPLYVWLTVLSLRWELIAVVTRRTWLWLLGALGLSAPQDIKGPASCLPLSLSLSPRPCLHVFGFVNFCLLYYTTPITTPYPCNHTNTPDNTDWNTLLSLRFRLLINHLKHCLLSAHKPKTLQLMTDCSVSWATAAPQYNEPLRWLVCYYRILCFMLCCQETRMNTRKMLCESSVLLQDSAHGTETNCCLKMRLLHHLSFLQLKNCDNEGCAPQGFVI